MSSLLNHQLNALGTEYESTSKFVPNTQFELRGLKGICNGDNVSDNFISLVCNPVRGYYHLGASLLTIRDKRIFSAYCSTRSSTYYSKCGM